MEYYVTYKVEARYIATVEADSTEEALELATSEFSDADFGAAQRYRRRTLHSQKTKKENSSGKRINSHGGMGKNRFFC